MLLAVLYVTNLGPLKIYFLNVIMLLLFGIYLWETGLGGTVWMALLGLKKFLVM